MTKFELFKTNNLYFDYLNQSEVSAQSYLIDSLKDESNYKNIYLDYENIEQAILNYKELNIFDNTDIATISLAEVREALSKN